MNYIRTMESERDILKIRLADKLIINRVFWSYADIKAEDVSDEILIEKVVIYLDIEDINSLFLIYPYKKIRDIWRKEIVILDPLYHSLNLLLAFLYFHIENPEKYIQKISQRHLLLN
jgi:hypothetical protein